MNHRCPHLSRREFLHRSAVSMTTGLAAISLASQGRAMAVLNERFELSIHQYSLKELFEKGSLKTMDYPSFVKQEFGISNVEFAVEFCEELRTDLKLADAIAARSEQLGIKHRALLCGAEPALDVPSEDGRRKGVEDHLQWAEVAKRLKCDYIRVRAASEGDRDEQLDYATQGIGALCDALAGSPLSVLVENITGFSADPEWLVELVKRVGPQRLGLIADFGNFNGDIYEGMRKLLPHTKSVCTKSWEFDEQGNETKIDFQKMMNLIKESPFQGCIAIEYLGEDPVEGVRKTAALIRRFV